MNKAYIQSMKENLLTIKVDIEDLAEICQERELNGIEYRALERVLQVLVESCIGIAKHLCKEKTKMAPADAYQAFERLEVNEILKGQVNWRRVIGLRNALVHDYLNIDRGIVKTVLSKDLHKDLFLFAEQALSLLDGSDGDG